MNSVEPFWTECLPGVWDRVVFSPEHKVDCHWHVVVETDRWTVVDPFEPGASGAPWSQSLKRGASGRIVLTNGNHQRASESWKRDLQLPVCGGTETIPVVEGWEVLPLPGGATGELATRPRGARYWILGDSLVNLPSRGLEILPSKYCLDPAELVRSLKHLLDTQFDSLLFAHGTPVLSVARTRLQKILAL